MLHLLLLLVASHMRQVASSFQKQCQTMKVLLKILGFVNEAHIKFFLTLLDETTTPTPHPPPKQHRALCAKLRALQAPQGSGRMLIVTFSTFSRQKHANTINQKIIYLI